MLAIEERVTNLEKSLEEFIRNVGIEFNKVYNLQMQNQIEFKAFKDEMKAFKDEMRVFRDKTEKVIEEFRAFKDEMRDFKDEMKDFKDEMKAFRDEMKEESRKKNKEWSNLAKKMGTIVEDLISPALRPVISKYFECEVNMEGQRMRRRKNGRNYEVDAIAACEDKVFMIEVKSTPRIIDVDEIKEKAKSFFEFFPEYKGKILIIIFGGITFPEDVIHYASKKGIYVMGWREWDYMDILNFDEINVLS
ncbi:hypothetical protein [Thermodesulfovibrio hydrogeniphilus]